MVNPKKEAIVVELTALENEGYNLAGNAPDDGIETQIRLVLEVGGMTVETASFMAGKLTKGAIAARRKIAEATRFEIKVLSASKSSTLLKVGIGKGKKSKKAVT